MANKPEILNEIEALSVHCRPPLMEANQRTSWLTDWCSDLADFPIEAIRIACRKWRLSGSTKFPTPGQLMPLVRENLPAEKTEKLTAWRPATEDEYRTMTLREKIREHQILSHEAFTKAGPMFKNAAGASMWKAAGRRLNPEDMPDEHRRWVAEGEYHGTRAKELREKLYGAMGLAAE